LTITLRDPLEHEVLKTFNIRHEVTRASKPVPGPDRGSK
jgi:hypothetical protein